MVIGGVQLLMIGVLGEYIGKLLSEIKARPVYFVAEHSVKSAGDAAKDERRGRPPRARRSKRNVAPAQRRIWLCADDYGISPCGQCRHPRTDRARAAQRHLGDDGGAASRRRRSRGARSAQFRRKARRARPACDADRAVPAAERGLRAAARRPFPAAQDDDARGDDAAAQPRARWRSRSPRSCKPSSPRSAGRPTSSTAISTCTCSRRCATPCSRWWPRWRPAPGCGNAAAPARRGGCRTARLAARYAERRLSPQSATARRRHQSGLCRRL